jgi:hypothetical protein
MAYDLLSKKQIPFNCAIGTVKGMPDSGPVMNGITKLFVLGGAAAIVYGILKKTAQAGEDRKLVQFYAKDEQKETQEMPAMSMNDVMLEGGQ